MLEYVFFHEEPVRRFCTFLAELGLSPSDQHTGESWLVSLDEETIDDVTADRIDAFYDEMFDRDQQLYDSGMQEDSENFGSAGVVVNLKDGTSVYANVPPDLLHRVMQVLTPLELGDLVNAIVDAVEKPDGRPLCKRQPG
ncbi:MAG: hypothetical protein P8Z33_02930 [Gammaproteobacteria bacterium]|jgi:hypothetical protein